MNCGREKINPFQFGKITPARRSCTSSIISSIALRALASSKWLKGSSISKNQMAAAAPWWWQPFVARHRAVFAGHSTVYGCCAALPFPQFFGRMKRIELSFISRFWKSVCSPKAAYPAKPRLVDSYGDLQFLRLKMFQRFIVIKMEPSKSIRIRYKNESMRFFLFLRALQF